MASLFAQAIVMACVSSAPIYNDACNKALDAGTRQLGIRQEIDRAEDKTVEITTNKVQKVVGREAFSLVGTGGFVLKTVRTKTVAFKLPTLGICSSVRNEVSPDSYKMILEWNL